MVCEIKLAVIALTVCVQLNTTVVNWVEGKFFAVTKFHLLLTIANLIGKTSSQKKVDP